MPLSLLCQPQLCCDYLLVMRKTYAQYITLAAYLSNQIVILLLLQMVLCFSHDIEMGAPHAKEII